MKALKWIGIGLGALAALAIVIVVLVFALTGGAVDAANEFLALVGKGRYEAAYRATAPQFRAQQNLGSFRAAMQRIGLDKYKSASWTSRNISGGRTMLRGTIETRDGGQIPATVILVDVNDKWKVYGMRVQPAGVSRRGGGTRASPAPEPDRAAMSRLALASLLALTTPSSAATSAPSTPRWLQPCGGSSRPKGSSGCFNASSIATSTSRRSATTSPSSAAKRGSSLRAASS